MRTNDDYRCGYGSDLHRLEAGPSLRIGGVDIPSPVSAVGHSDADVLLHAIADALLGSVAAGDIGELFPDDDPANAAVDSRRIVEAAVARVGQAGFALVNLDTVIHLQSPKLLPHRERIVGSLQEILGVAVDRISVKAKTGESVGPIGRGEAISVDAFVLVTRQGNA